jgi:hypothetical protein
MNKIIFTFMAVLSLVLLAGIISAGAWPPPINPDTDNDGVLDSVDLCPNTALGEVVNLDGCSIEQLCQGNWKNHGKYVSCVARTSKIFIELGLITEEHGAIVSEAAQSEIGK